MEQYATKCDRKVACIQDQVTVTLVVAVNLMAEMKEALVRKTDVGWVSFFHKLSDADRPLIAAHKGLSEIRQDSLWSSFAREFRPLSQVQQFESMDSHEFLFDMDLAKKAEEVSKFKKLMGEFTGKKNGAWRVEVN